jgi:hypothetical protein
MSRPAPAGIIANPASGKDIRRLVGHASVFDNNEKVQIVRRVMLALEAAGVRRALIMPDYFGICGRAVDGLAIGLTVEQAITCWSGSEADSTAAAQAMELAGVAALITLGGDGTNRAVAAGVEMTPLIPVSTGTNNVFPVMMEGTSAGLAAGALATGLVGAAEVSTPSKRLRVICPDGCETLALVDVAVLTPGFVGARAVWQPEHVLRVLVTSASPAETGMAGLAGLLREVGPDEDYGLDITLGHGSGTALRAPLAPGLFAPLRVARTELLRKDAAVRIDGPCLLALDGERGIEVPPGSAAMVTLDRRGPYVVDVKRCLSLAARRGLLRDGC